MHGKLSVSTIRHIEQDSKYFQLENAVENAGD